MKPPIRILVADDHAITRFGIISLLETEVDFTVVGQAEDGEAAIAEAKRTHPDVIIMDLMMPGMDGTEATRRIISNQSDAKILILTTFGTADGIAHALQAGARGAVLKSTDFSDLVDAIRTVAHGKEYISADIKEIIAAEPPIPPLSARQSEILESIIKGLTNKEIAYNLGISLPVVKEHVSGLFAKIGATNRSEAAAIALRRHLLKV